MSTFDQKDGHCGWSSDETATATVSLEGIVTGWSEGARRLLGHRASEVVGRAAVDLLFTRETPEATGVSLSASQEWSGTAAVRHRDGHRVDLTLRAHPSLGVDGMAQGFVVSATVGTADPELSRTMLEWAFVQSSIGLTTYSPASRSWQMNAAAESGEQVPYPALLREPPGDGGFLTCVRRVAEEGRALQYAYVAPAPASPSANRRAWVIELWPVRDPGTGEVVGVGTATFDSSEEYSARQRLALLKEAGARIGTTLSVTRTAEELADLAVPRLADFVSVDLLDPVLRGEEPVPGPVNAAVVLRRVAHQSVTATGPTVPAGGVPEAAVDLGAVDTYPPYAPPARSLTTGQPLLSGEDDPDFVRWVAEHERRSARVREYGFHSVMATPLRARGITLGVAVFARAEGSEPFVHDDLLLAEELAGRAAVGVDNARRYTRERTNALTLQHSLLPRDLPKQAAVEVAYRYLPADTGAGVGGDWFDVVPLSGTRAALVVGDVVGHGVHASAAMGRLRTAVRTLADVDLPPDELMTHLDDLVIHLNSDDNHADSLVRDDTGEIGATCLYAVYDPVSRVCTLASAGHLPPAVLLPDGTVSMVRLSPGPLLGVGGLPFESTEVELPEGSLLAFYTDGLVEARDRDVSVGVGRLCQALASPVPSLDVTCDAILKALLADLTDRVEAWGQADQYFKGPWEGCQVGGKTLGIPHNSNCLALYYNIRMLESAGVAPPTTWDELASAAQRLTTGDRFGLALSAVKTEEGVFQFLPFLWQAGGDLDTFATYGATALSFLDDLVAKGSVSEQCVGWTQQDVNARFLNRRAAMQINGPWQTPTLKSADFDWDVVALPRDQEAATCLGGENWVVMAPSKHVDKAWQVVEYTQRPSALVPYLVASGGLPSRKDLADQGTWASDPVLRLFVSQLSVARPRRYGPRYADISQTVAETEQAVLTGSASPSAAAKTAAVKIDKALASR